MIENFKKQTVDFDVVIIGAGPSGSVAAAKLQKEGFSVLILEKSTFPRFVIGESLLPLSLEILDKVDLLTSVKNSGFQIKTGATFYSKDSHCFFDFSKQHFNGYSYSYQVKRADFDNVLVRTVESRGVQLKFNCKVTNFKNSKKINTVNYLEEDVQKKVKCKFVLDASGYGRVLPKLLGLSKSVNSIPKGAVYTHLTDENSGKSTNHIYVHSFSNNSAWAWCIPFSDRTASVGIVGDLEYIEKCKLKSDEEYLKIIQSFPFFNKRFSSAKILRPVQSTVNYSVGVKTLYGKGFALSGNTTEFVDPIFSSGVTFAIVSGYKAAEMIAVQLKGGLVNWQKSYENELLEGLSVFKSFVQAWYDGDLEKIFFTEEINEAIKNQICSVLAGYVWDKSNPFVKKHDTLLKALSNVISI